MPTWMLIAKGPALRFVLGVCALGLLRLLLLTVLDMMNAIRRAGDRRLPLPQIARQTLSWVLPLARLHRSRPAYSFASFLLHLGILFAGFFLANHLDILQDSLGVSWAALPKPALDALTVMAMFGGAYLLFYRLYAASSRRLSKLSDYLLLVILLSIIASGYIAGQPWNPIPYNGLMLFHTLNGAALLLVIPFTKIAHCVLYPLIRLGSEIAWHFPPRGGEQVIQTLYGPEGRKI